MGKIGVLVPTGMNRLECQAVSLKLSESSLALSEEATINPNDLLKFDEWIRVSNARFIYRELLQELETKAKFMTWDDVKNQFKNIKTLDLDASIKYLLTNKFIKETYIEMDLYQTKSD
jgi:hypothetical protein